MVGDSVSRASRTLGVFNGRTKWAAYTLETSDMTDNSPQFPAASIGRLPAVTVEFPREMRLADFAAMAAKAGYLVRWIRRGRKS